MVGMMEVERVCKRCRRAKVYSITLALAAAKVCGLKFRYYPYVLLLSYPKPSDKLHTHNSLLSRVYGYSVSYDKLHMYVSILIHTGRYG